VLQIKLNKDIEIEARKVRLRRNGEVGMKNPGRGIESKDRKGGEEIQI
jgi:hypothetical protein